MDHAGGETAHRSELLCSRDRAIRVDAIRDILADGDHVTHLTGVVGPHWDLADHPVTKVAFRTRRLLFDALDLAAFEYAGKLLLQHVTRLAREYVENVFPV